MITSQREAVIFSLLDERGVVSIRDLAAACPNVSTVTLRRDLVRLEDGRRLKRTRGGAIRIDDRALDAQPGGEPSRAFDAIILPPVEGRSAHTLRQQAIRTGIPFLAESAPQAGGVYLGPANFDGSRRLGRHAGQIHRAKAERAEILSVSLAPLANARERLDGFLAGFREAFAGEIVVHKAEGHGTLKEALRRAKDAMRAHPTIDVIFGMNDHTIIGALELAGRLGLGHADGYSVGGEGGALFDALAAEGRLKATLALFPEVVGRLAIDGICRIFAGDSLGEAIVTPAEVLSPQTLQTYYSRDSGQWRLRPEMLDRMCAGKLFTGPSVAGRTISFMLHYPSHDWYRNLAAAMRQRCAEFGIHFAARNAEDEVAEQIRLIRRMIAAAAAADIAPREIVLIDGGQASQFLAEALKKAGRPLTVITNSLDVLEILADTPGIKLMLTAGEFQPRTRTLVGPSVGALLETMRVDKAFVSPDGVSSSFGLSFEDERAALVCRRFAEVARRVVVLADHSVIGLESNVQAVRSPHFHTVFTDAGTLASYRLQLSSAGLGVTVVDDEG
jgi:DeoR/GlpR family transcriptional regulator of sugar metabolism